MAKHENTSIHTTEVYPDDASDHPITRQLATHTTSPELPPRWPAEPHALTPEPATERWLLAFDVALCLVPLALIAKAVLCIVASVIDKGARGYLIDEVHALTLYLIRFNHQVTNQLPLSDIQRQLSNILQLTTIFTVVFILIITIVVRRLALYKAQEGATVAKLEQLQASISLPGTLKAIWSLRAFTSRTSAILLMIWGWFYLGSQATTSEYEYRNSDAFWNVPIAFFSPEKSSLFFSNHSRASVSQIQLSNINSMYNIFSLDSSGDASTPAPADLNGAVKLPYVRADGTPYVGANMLHRDRHGYYDVSHSSQMTYASSLGTNIYYLINNNEVSNGVYVNGLEGDFTYNTTFFNVSCSETEARNASAFPSGTLDYTQISINATKNASTSPIGPGDPPAGFDIWARPNATSYVLHTFCHLDLITVEVKAGCTAAKCSAKKMRIAPGTVPINRTVFDNTNFTSLFFNSLLFANGPPRGYSLQGEDTAGSIVETIMDSFDYLITAADGIPVGYDFAFGKSIDDSAQSLAMTTMINTYYDISLDPTQGTINDDNVYNGPLADVLTGNVRSKDWITGHMKGAAFEPQYRLSIPWVIVDLISCQILLLAATLAMWLRKRTLAPDIFGYVSSLTRDNPHVNLPDSGSTLSGLERARMLKNVRVKIADVAGEDGVGRVGLRYAGLAADLNVQMAHLKKDRQYV